MKKTLNEQVFLIKQMMGKLNEQTSFNDYNNMSWSERKAFSRRWEDRELDNNKKRLEKTHFSGGSMHEDFGVLQSKVDSIFNMWDHFAAEIRDVLTVVKINMRDGDIKGHVQAEQKLYEIQDNLQQLYKVVNNLEEPINNISKEMGELSNPDDPIYHNSEEDEEQV